MIRKIGNKIYKFATVLDSSQALILLFSELIIGAFISFFSFYFFLKIAANVLNNDFFGFDKKVSGFIYSFRSPDLTPIMNFFSILGWDWMVLLAFLIVGILIWKKYKHEALVFLIAFLGGVFMNYFLKFFIARPRPFGQAITPESFYSFPSGHAMNSFVFYGMLAFFIFRFTRNKKISTFVAFLCMLLIILICISRIYLGVHYPTDVLAGLVAGFWWLVTVILAEKTIRFYKIFKEIKKIR